MIESEPLKELSQHFINRMIYKQLVAMISPTPYGHLKIS
jgi:hypothetical protein